MSGASCLLLMAVSGGKWTVCLKRLLLFGLNVCFSESDVEGGVFEGMGGVGVFGAADELPAVSFGCITRRGSGHRGTSSPQPFSLLDIQLCGGKKRN